MPRKGTATCELGTRIEDTDVGVMRAAKGHCDLKLLYKYYQPTPVGVMRAAKGHCDNSPHWLYGSALVGVMRAAKGHCDNG